MELNKKYDIEEFYIGELYLYTHFSNFTFATYDPKNKDKINIFSKSGAINFQEDMESRYIDYETGREYTGFLTIFYRQGNKYICLHDGMPYEIKGNNFIENLIPLKELLPKINTQLLSKISIHKALELFTILFKNNKREIQLYDANQYPVSDFCVGDIVLKESFHQESKPESRCQYFNLPYHIMLNNEGLTIHSFNESNYINRVYRCLFLRQGVDLYNINNHQFYNPSEDSFQAIISFKDYITETEAKQIEGTISIPKALKRFKKTLQ